MVSIILDTALARSAEFAGLVFAKVCEAVLAVRFLSVFASNSDTGVIYCIYFLTFLPDYLSEVRLFRSVIMMLFNFLESSEYGVSVNLM